MNYQEFIAQVIKKLPLCLEEGSDIQLQQIRRNNGVQAEGLVVRRPGEAVCPVIPVMPLYRQLCSGAALDEILQNIVKQCKHSKTSIELECSFLTDPNALRRNVRFRLVNYEANRKMLQEVPHRRYLDLAFVYDYMLEEKGFGTGSILVRKDELKHWGVAEEELHECALHNGWEKWPPYFADIRTVMEELTGESYMELPAEPEIPLYVLSNRERCHGACWMSDPKVQKTIAGMMRGDYYVLPSSVHECMVVPSHAISQQQELELMVREINRECVAQEEILSDSVYRYSCNEETLLLAGSGNASVRE